MTRPSSLVQRLLLIAVPSIVVSVLVGGYALSLSFRESVEAALDMRLQAIQRVLVASLEVSDGRLTLSRSLGEPRFDQVYSGWYWQVRQGDETLLVSRSLWDADLPQGGRGDGALWRGAVIGPRDQPLRLVEQQITLPDWPAPLHVALAASTEEIIAETGRFDRLLAATLAALTLIVAGMVALQLRYGLRPLRLLSGDLEAIRRGSKRRLEPRYPKEVAPLVEAMNNLLDHNDEVVRRARAHAGNLAHGLKTPLTLLSVDAQALPPGQSAAVRRHIEDMRDIVEHHLTRAATAANAAVIGARTEVRPVAEALIASLAKMFADKRLRFSVDVSGGLAFRGERQDMEEMLGNLLENACKWASGAVEVTARAESDSRMILIVADDGPGLTAEQCRQALERGRRMDERSPGSGLGLAIVNDIVEIYEGDIRLDGAPLGGLRVVIRLPAAPR